MEVFIRRNPIGYTTGDLEDVEELEEKLRGLQSFHPLSDAEEVIVEVTAPWGTIKRLLAEPFFNSIWFDPKKPGPAIAYHCGVCGIEECAPEPMLPEGWGLSQPDEEGSQHWLCRQCKQSRGD